MFRPGLLTLLILLPTFGVDAGSLGFGPERPVSTPVIEPAFVSPVQPKIASNGNMFLAVWKSGSSTLRAARFTSSGEMLDPISLVISRDAIGYPAASLTFDVSHGPDGFVVAYDCLTPITQRLTICVASVALDGTVRSLAEVPRSGSIPRMPSIAWNGTRYLLAWSQSPVSAQFFDREGNPEGTELRFSFSSLQPSVVAVGADFVIVYSRDQQFFAEYVAHDGTVLRKLSFNTAGFIHGFDVSTDERDVLVVWAESERIHFPAVLTLKSKSLPSDGRFVKEEQIVDASLFPADPALTWTGSGYVVSYTANAPRPTELVTYLQRDTAIHALSLSPQGQVTSSPIIVANAPGFQGPSALAASGADVAVAWIEQGPGRASAAARLLTGSAEPLVLSREFASQGSPSGAAISDGVTLAWTERVGPTLKSKVFVGRVRDSDAQVDGRGLPVRESDFDQLRPALHTHWVAWIEQPPTGPSSVVARRLGADGAPFGDTVAVGDAARGSGVAMSAIGANHLIVWNAPDGRLVGARMSAAGNVFDRPPIVIGEARLTKAIIATDGHRYLVVWDTTSTLPCYSLCAPGPAPVALLLDAGGRPVGPLQRLADFGSAYSVVWNGTDFVVLVGGYVERAGVPIFNGTFVRTIDQGGRLTSDEVMRIEPPLGFSGGPFSWDAVRREYVLVSIEYNAATSDYTMAARRLDSNFRVIDETTLDADGIGSPLLIQRSDGSLLVAYSRSLGDYSRIFTRTIEDIPRRRSVSPR